MPSLSSGIDLLANIFKTSRDSRRRAASRRLASPVPLESRRLLTHHVLHSVTTSASSDHAEKLKPSKKDPIPNSFAGDWSVNALNGVTLHLIQKNFNTVKGKSEVATNPLTQILPAHPKFKGEILGGSNHLVGTIQGKFRPIDKSGITTTFRFDFDILRTSETQFTGTSTYTEGGLGGSPQSIIGTKIT